MEANRVRNQVGPTLKWKQYSTPIVIGGPCSVESQEQLASLIPFLEVHPKITMYRFGVWKPRSRPHSFDGAGEKALKWLAQYNFSKPILIEVGDPQHVEMALKEGFFHFWIGARTTVNPFLVQRIVDSLKGVEQVSILIKNPINPDLGLWIGAIERFLNAGITEIAACHRGFTFFRGSRFRNVPHWELPLRLKEHFPNIPLICDPSHISGKKDLIQEIAQQAIDLGFDGLMIEIHPNPSSALSDKEQQLTPQEFETLLSQLHFKQASTTTPHYQQQLYRLRTLIDEIDEELLHLLAKRNAIVQEIGKLKDKYGIQYLQWKRWIELLRQRLNLAQKLGLPLQYIYELFHHLHMMAIETQREKPKDFFNLQKNQMTALSRDFFEGLGYLAYAVSMADGELEQEEAVALAMELIDRFGTYLADTKGLRTRAAYENAAQKRLSSQEALDKAFEAFSYVKNDAKKYQDTIIKILEEVLLSDREMEEEEVELLDTIKIRFQQL